jgi:hypothetical protein
LCAGGCPGNNSDRTDRKGAERALTVIQGVHIGASLQQQASNVYMTVHGYPVQRSVLHIVPRAHIGATSYSARDIPAPVE